MASTPTQNRSWYCTDYGTMILKKNWIRHLQKKHPQQYNEQRSQPLSQPQVSCIHCHKKISLSGKSRHIKLMHPEFYRSRSSRSTSDNINSPVDSNNQTDGISYGTPQYKFDITTDALQRTITNLKSISRQFSKPGTRLAEEESTYIANMNRTMNVQPLSGEEYMNTRLFKHF